MSGGSSMYAARTRASRMATPCRTRPGGARAAGSASRAALRAARAGCARIESSASSAPTAASASSTAACALSTSAATAESCDVRTPSCAFDCAMSALQGRDARVDCRLLVRGIVRCRRRDDDQRENEPEEGEQSPSHRSSFAHRQVDPPRNRARAPEARRDVAAEHADLRAVVLVGDRARAVVELELLEGRERAVARLEQLEPTDLVLVEFVERVRLRLGLAEERERDHDDAGHGERRSEHECEGQRVAGRPTVEARATSRRCSRRSGHSVITEPSRNTSPASQMRLTSGLTKTRK